MQLYMWTATEIRSMSLPDVPEGTFEVKDPADNQPIFAVTAEENAWRIILHGMTLFSGKTTMLTLDTPLQLRVGRRAERMQLCLTEGGMPARRYARCPVDPGTVLAIGSAPDNEIICRQPYMAPYHLRLTSQTGGWQLTILDDKLGAYINGRRASSGSLKAGDVVSILELKLIVVPGLLAFNSPGEQTHLRQGSRLHLMPSPPVSREDAFVSTPVEDFYYRAPRFSEGIIREAISVDSPPAAHEPSQTNAILTMAPSLLSGVVSLAVATNPLMPLAALAGATIFPMLNRHNAEKQQAEDEIKRKEAYKAYLDDIERHIADVTAKQEAVLRRMHPPLEEQMAFALRDHRLWQYNSEQADYLELRLGTGSLPLEYDITFPQERFELQSDPMKQLMQELKRRERRLEGVPILLTLAEFFQVGITGDLEARSALVANLLIQLTMNYGYDELKLCFIGKPLPELEQFSWLPHTWDNAKQNHYLAETEDELRQLLPMLDEMLAGRELTHHIEKGKNLPEAGEPELIVVLFEDRISQAGVVTRLLMEKRYRGLRVITVTGESRRLPRRCDVIVSLDHGCGQMVWQTENGRGSRAFMPDASALGAARRLIYAMANTYLDLPDTSSRLPDSVPFLDLFGVSDVHALNVLTRWRRNNPTVSLAAPIGIDEDGGLCCLDVHEKGDGQHGLIAGTTGSGKSELIMTYVLSLAVNFSPEEVTFLLIDYKGGGMATAFERLPHTAGIITNLDGNAVNRSLLAIQSELVRRQAVFHEAEQALDATGMNIIKYQRLYREKRVSTPLPHLLIICDEFAELKTQEPEFMQKLISASRIGRSLGVHLILATQRPSGVVDDQIWSNTNWRLCLRVQSARDSQDIIKCPDAATLSKVGRFYIQVGYSVLKQAQSGFTGAPYLPGVHTTTGGGVEVLDRLGRVLEHSEIPRSSKSVKISYQIKAVVDHLATVAESKNLRAQTIWLPPLEPKISLADIRQRYSVSDVPFALEPVLGEIDDPSTQSRRLLRMNLQDGKNVMVYGTVGSGKVMLLRTVLEDMLLYHGPEELQVYILDYGDDGLSAFLDAPQVGDVLDSRDDEKLKFLQAYLRAELERRKSIMGGHMGEASLAERLQAAGLSVILVILHHAHKLKDKLGDDSAPFIELLREGPRYGMNFLGTTISTNLLGFKMQDAFARSYVLQLEKKDEYYTLIGRLDGFQPVHIRGRGVIRLPDALCEYQTASSDHEVSELCAQLRERYPHTGAPSIRIMPKRVTAAEMADDVDPATPWRLPIGMDTETLAPVYLNLHTSRVRLILGLRSDTVSLFNEMLSLLVSMGTNVTVWGTEDIREVAGVRYVPAETQASSTLLQELIMAGVDVPERVIIVPAMDAVLDALRQTKLQPGLDDLKTLLNPAVGNGVLTATVYNDIEFKRFLEKLGANARCSFIIGLTDQAAKAIRAEKWFQEKVGNDAILLGRGVYSQMTVKVSNGSRLSSKEEAFPFGFEVRDTVGRKIKLLSE